ncbi:Stk1 family PASTA domain-containing Ser/Thr kinase [Brevibacterium sandarakinum]|uniref:Stk1 family PASTA domain-containing Ser/Thr kinase n=1 Tax=Brevibacterium sandarakinum TaxID=629680 RepID=UPI002656A062|nr:Stk1 family PASTA domain-containing Ser/Thr kinase [Brevibacterium sandarakinum]MDN5657880.1 Stk1 family PASTA domain-containing Ser/Thr kinase [Brevibacterium sandarakinum]
MNEPKVLSGRYEVRALLGRGGMAEVHEGVDNRLGRRVAIKLLRSDLARDPSFHTRLKREAQSAAGLNHPGIVAVYDSGEEDFVETGGSTVSVPFIVMEYVEGQTLREVLNEHGTLTIDEALNVVAGVLAPLEYSHRNGIVHRDIKPANVMLTPEGDIKVMDFGIARALKDNSGLTQTQSVVGTAQYLSPEQARGEVVDARSDLYSTACLLYELLVGRPPFVGDSQLAVAYQHVGETPQPPSFYNPNVPPEVDRLLMHSLLKDRDERYQDAYIFREDVLAARDARPLSFDDDVDRTQAFPMAGAMMGPPQYAQDPEVDPETGAVSTIMAKQDEAPPPRRSRAWIWIGSIFVLLALAAIALWVYEINKPPDIIQVEVTDVADMDANEAESALIQQGLRVDRDEAYSEDVDEGKAIKTDPPGGQRVEQDSVVKLIISSGPESVEVPDVSGKAEEDARKILNDGKLQAGTHISQNSPDVEKGVVIETKPGSGSEVDVDSNVDLVVSSGMVEVPDVTGKTAKEACKILEGDDYQLECKTEEVETADEEAKKVFEQSSTAGSDVKQGSEITVMVAKKPPEPSPSIPSVPGGVPTSPSDDGGSDDNDNDNDNNGGNNGGNNGNNGNNDDGNNNGQDDDNAIGGGDSWFNGYSSAG